MSDPSDIYQALIGGPPTAAAKQALLVEALRKRNTMGQMAQLSGDPVLNPMGAQMSKGADSQAEELGQQRIANQQLSQSGAYQTGELEDKAGVLKESIRQHDMEMQEKKMELGLGEYGGGVDDIAKKIAHYDLPPISSYGMKNPRAFNIMDRATQINPDYDATQYSAKKKAKSDFGSGPKGDQARRFGVGNDHLDTLDTLIDAMGSGNIQKVNQIKQMWQTQTGKPAPTTYEAAAELAADEVAGAIVGQGRSAGALADREKIQAKYSAAHSPDILHSVNATYRTMMTDQLAGLEQQYKAATGLGDFRDTYLTKKSKTALEARDVAKAAEDTPVGAQKGWGIKLVTP